MPFNTKYPLTMSMGWDFILSARISVEGFVQRIDVDPVIFLKDQSVFYLAKIKKEWEQELKQRLLSRGCNSHQVINNECLVVKMKRGKQIPDIF